MKNKEVIRWIATFLSLILLIQAFPASVIAENASVSRTAEILPEESQEAVPVEEVKEKRTEYAKHFRMSDGTYQMVAYPIPVHYQASQGWEEINNTLKEESGAIVTTSSPAPVSFGLHTQDELLTIGKEDQAISFQLMGQKIGKSKVKAQNTQIKAERQPAQSGNLFEYENRLESEVLYPEILSNVDVKYEVIGNSVKESILIKKKKQQAISI